MRSKLIGMAGLVLAGLLYLGSAANAQTFVYTGAPGPATQIGWNFGHVSRCAVKISGTTVWYIFIIEEGGWGITNDANVAASVSPVCQTGNRIAVRVTKLSPFAWDYVYQYPFK